VQISPAVICTVALTVVYVSVYLFLWIAQTFMPAGLQRGALAMSSAVRKAPMFAVVFLASRMRALQLDPPHGMPPPWMAGMDPQQYQAMMQALQAQMMGKKDKKKDKKDKKEKKDKKKRRDDEDDDEQDEDGAPKKRRIDDDDF